MKKIKFKLDDEIYEQAKGLVGKEFVSLRELILTAIRDKGIKYGVWPYKPKSAYDLILERRLKRINSPYVRRVYE